MKGARAVRRRTASGLDVRDGLVEASKCKQKTMRPADHPSVSDLRRRRDLVWLYLASLGMTPLEIERACALANKGHWAIRKRLNQAMAHHERRQRG